MEQLMAYNQEGSIKDYCDSFRILFDQVRNLEEISEFYAIYLFICGLEPEIREIFVRWHQYSCTEVEDMMSLALKIDSNGLQDSFSPFDPNSSFYNKDLEFDINITLKELMKDNEWFRIGMIQETDDNIVHETIVDEEIDNVVLEENGYDNKTAFKVFDEMPLRSDMTFDSKENNQQEMVGVVSQDRGIELVLEPINVEVLEIKKEYKESYIPSKIGKLGNNPESFSGNGLNIDLGYVEMLVPHLHPYEYPLVQNSSRIDVQGNVLIGNNKIIRQSPALVPLEICDDKDFVQFYYIDQSIRIQMGRLMVVVHTRHKWKEKQLFLHMITNAKVVYLITCFITIGIYKWHKWRFKLGNKNTMWDFTEDGEKLRENLEIFQWQMYDGTWENTVAFAYNQFYFGRGIELVFRGIFLLREAMIGLGYEGGVAALFTEAWEPYQDLILEFEKDCFVKAYHKRLNSDNFNTKFIDAWCVGYHSKIDALSLWLAKEVIFCRTKRDNPIENGYAGNYTLGRTRDGVDCSDVKPLQIIHPYGPGFCVNGNYELPPMMIQMRIQWWPIFSEEFMKCCYFYNLTCRKLLIGYCHINGKKSTTEHVKGPKWVNMVIINYKDLDISKFKVSHYVNHVECVDMLCLMDMEADM